MSDTKFTEQAYNKYLTNRAERPSGASDAVTEKVLGEISYSQFQTNTVEQQEVAIAESEENKSDDLAAEIVDSGVSEEEDGLRERSMEYAFAPESYDEEMANAKADAKQLKDELLRNPQFHSLSLPQIGIKKRMIAIRHKSDIRIYINPIIVWQGGLGLIAQTEECMDEHKYLIFRPTEIVVAFTTLRGIAQETNLTGLAAAEFVKQSDRLNGILLWDFGKECDNWDTMSERTKENFVNGYLQDLHDAFKTTQKIVNADEELNEMQAKYAQIKDEMKKELEEELKKKKDLARAKERKKKAQQRGTSIWNA